MSRELYVALEEGTVVTRCQSRNVGISAIEPLPQGGVRLVCMSVDGAETMRASFRSNLIRQGAVRSKHRPNTPLW